MSGAHITIAAGRYSSLALNALPPVNLLPAGAMPETCGAVRAPAQASGALSSVSAKATRLRSRRSGSPPPHSPRRETPLSAGPAGLPIRPCTSGCSGAPGRHPRPAVAPSAGSSACGPKAAPCPPRPHPRPRHPPTTVRHPCRRAPAPHARADPQHKGAGGAPGGGGVDAPTAPPVLRGSDARSGRGSAHSPPGRGAVHRPSCSGRGGTASAGRGALVSHQAGGGARAGT